MALPVNSRGVDGFVKFNKFGKLIGAQGETTPLATPASSSPTGAAGGDLAGSYPDPTVPGLAGKVPTTRNVNGHPLSADVTVSKSDVGLGNVDNTSDANKPVSTAQQTALNLKANTSSLAPVATSGVYSDLTGKPSALPPNGAASGDLAGSYPNPTVANLHLSADTAIGHKLTNVSDGTASGDAVNLGQLTAAVEGRQNKDPALWGTTGNITLSGLGTQANGEWTGSLTAGARILVRGQSSSADNGIYLASAGGWTRSLDGNTGAEITNASVLVLLGATLTGDTFTQTATVSTIGTDPQTWTQTGEGATYAADGTSVVLTGTTFSRPALTGDATAPAGSSVVTLPVVNPNVGSFGTGSQVPTVTLNAKGQVTGGANTPIAIAESQVTSLVSDLAAKAPLSYVDSAVSNSGTFAFFNGMA